MDRLIESALNAAALRPDGLIDHLTYISYAHNRDRSPEISPERWARIYPNASAMEAKYQADRVKCLGPECPIAAGECDKAGECYLWRCMNPHAPKPESD